MLCLKQFRDCSGDQLLIASPVHHLSPSGNHLGTVQWMPMCRGRGAGKDGALGEGGSAGLPLPQGLPILCPRCPQTHLTCNVDGEEDPGQRQHGEYALRRTPSRFSRQAPREFCTPSRNLVCLASASVSARLLLAEWLTLPGCQISMFQWERG